MLRLISVLLAGLLLCGQTPMVPGFPPGTFQNRAAIDATGGGSSYTGPGDAQTFLVWGSVARVYNNAAASTSTSLADLVDSAAPTTVICTLRGTTAGTVDLVGTYCTGSVTPATKCAAATGGVCNVNKIYDGTGNTSGWTQTTGSKQPVLTFSAINGLPAMTFTSGNATIMGNATGVTQAQPYTVLGVAKRTANFTTVQEVVASTGNDVEFQFDSAVDSARVYAGVGVGYTALVTDNAFHVLQGTGNGVSGTMNADGLTQQVGNSGANTLSGNVSIGGYLTSIYLTGQVAEVGIYAGTYNATVQSNTRTQYGL